MKTKHLLILLSISIFFLACTNTNSETQEKKPSISKIEEKIIPEEKLTQKQEVPRNSTKEEDPKLTYLKTFIPEGYKLFHHYEGDLNRDERKNDVLLIAHNPNLEEEGSDVPRPCLILTRNEDGKLSLAARNDKAVLCASCGGVFGDPFDNVTIKNGYFSTEHYGGSSRRWTQINTFKYDEVKKDWFLHRTGGEHFHMAEPDKTEEEVKTVKDFGVVRFADYE